MLNKYNKQLVLNYISGNDIEEYSIEELENDVSFMTDVMKMSKDKNMYVLASDMVKKNYSFVTSIIKEYKSDIKFIMQVADYYLNNAKVNSDDVTKEELNVIMCSLIKDEDDKMKYAISATVCYETLLVDLRCSYNEEIKKVPNIIEFGLGFIYIYDKYINKSPIVLEFFAERMINNLFYNSGLKLDEILHKNFKSAEDVYKKGINNFIIDYVSSYDSSLSGYLAVHTDIISGISKDINYKLKLWKSYEINNYKRKIAIIWQEGQKQYDLYRGLTHTFSEFLDTVIDDLGCTELYLKYSDDSVGNVINKSDLNLGDIAFMNDLKKIVLTTFETAKIDDTSDDYNEKVSAKIFKFPKKASN